jgi:hypothetical protein
MATTTEYPQTEILTETPVETRKPMKLSEALRLGSMATKQSHGSWHTKVDGEDHMCAISTAWFALTGEKEYDAQSSKLQRMLAGRVVTHPLTNS